jgi:transcription-repair coupling factor (superfamily II helicase)
MDVLAAYVRREKTRRMPYRQDLEGRMELFESGFKYEETKDQVKAIGVVKEDMVWKVKPMDRLVAGDVGFGKTEVAMRALYRSCLNSRQSVLLAPTSVLASQHYKNAVERFKGTGVRIELLRGGGGKAGEEIRKALKEGSVGLVVGTHAILGKGVEFRNLGLVVIDEEQRFGVKQKERLKVLSSGVDVLTLSATPIPRTLQMSLSGVRDTTTIRTPPKGRVPVKTTVEKFDAKKVGEAVKKEVRWTRSEATGSNISHICTTNNLLLVASLITDGKRGTGVRCRSKDWDD